jgi:hypothetical protein
MSAPQGSTDHSGGWGVMPNNSAVPSQRTAPNIVAFPGDAPKPPKPQPHQPPIPHDLSLIPPPQGHGDPDGWGYYTAYTSGLKHLPTTSFNNKLKGDLDSQYHEPAPSDKQDNLLPRDEGTPLYSSALLKQLGDACKYLIDIDSTYRPMYMDVMRLYHISERRQLNENEINKIKEYEIIINKALSEIKPPAGAPPLPSTSPPFTPPTTPPTQPRTHVPSDPAPPAHPPIASIAPPPAPEEEYPTAFPDPDVTTAYPSLTPTKDLSKFLDTPNNFELNKWFNSRFNTPFNASSLHPNIQDPLKTPEIEEKHDDMSDVRADSANTIAQHFGLKGKKNRLESIAYILKTPKAKVILDELRKQKSLTTNKSQKAWVRNYLRTN